MEKQSKEHAKFSSMLELKEHELRLLEERAAQSLHALRVGQLAEQEMELVAAKREVVECDARGQEASRKHKQLQEQEQALRQKREVRKTTRSINMDGKDGNADRVPFFGFLDRNQAKLKALEKVLAKVKTAFEEMKQKLKAREQRAKVLQLEMTQLKKENTNLDEQVRQREQADGH